MRIGFFPNMGKSTIMAVLKMAAHICREEQIEVYLPDDLERPDTYKVCLLYTSPSPRDA